MRDLIKSIAPLRRLYYRYRLARSATSQDDTHELIAALSKNSPKTFVEFGFHPTEFNCILLARDPKWTGLLIDGEDYAPDAERLFHRGVQGQQAFLTLDNIDMVRRAFRELGVLSIDVDGNDYWFLKALIDIEPSLICTEYNSSFGFEPITVPYDPDFDRATTHPRGWYHGASLTALAKLCASHGYGLAAVSSSGTNALFSRDGQLDPEMAWKPSVLRYRYSGIPHERQWQSLKEMPFETV